MYEYGAMYKIVKMQPNFIENAVKMINNSFGNVELLSFIG